MEIGYSPLSIQEIKAITQKQAFNLNIGVLGHVDSGKTSLCKVLSEVTSTASLDKNPQSQERGITLDLGFSAFFTRVPVGVSEYVGDKQYLQFTLVDCPGHASLLKTVIGGAQIIDLMFLVVDVNKGIQTQTGECISIAELFVDKMIVILNKVDTIENPEQILPKKVQSLRKVFQKTKYGANVSIVPFSTKSPEKHLPELMNALFTILAIPQRDDKGSFLMLIDHCFPIKGKGSVVTGTVISGSIKPNDEVEFPMTKETKKVKSLQMFKKPVNSAIQGDRVALLFTQLESDRIERGLCCTPNYVTRMENIIIEFNKIRYFKLPIKTKAKFHVISGHQVSMASIRLFYNNIPPHPDKKLKFDFKEQYTTAESYQQLISSSLTESPPTIYAILTFQKQFYSNLLSTVIGYKFDGENQNICRLAFSGPIIAALRTQQIQAGILKISKEKTKQGRIDKVVDKHTVIIKDLFRKETNIQQFVNKEVVIERTGVSGRIIGGFGNSGKVKAYFEENILSVGGEEIDEVKLMDEKVVMSYKKYYYTKQ